MPPTLDVSSTIHNTYLTHTFNTLRMHTLPQIYNWCKLNHLNQQSCTLLTPGLNFVLNLCCHSTEKEDMKFKKNTAGHWFSTCGPLMAQSAQPCGPCDILRAVQIVLDAAHNGI